MADTGKKPKYPCIKCRKNVPKTVKSVQCKTCLLWIHVECQNTVWIPANIYSIMADQASAGLGFFWHCESCLASSVRLEAAINQCELRVKEVEQRTERTEGLVKDLDRRMDKVESSNVRTENKMMEIKEALKKEIYTEFRDRKQRQKNLVLHRVGEAGHNVKNLRTGETGTSGAATTSLKPWGLESPAQQCSSAGELEKGERHLGEGSWIQGQQRQGNRVD